MSQAPEQSAPPEGDGSIDPSPPTGGESSAQEDVALETLPPSVPPRRRTPQVPAASEPGPRRRRGSTLLVVLAVLLIAALLKTFVIQTFEIPSGSMEDTLLAGDRVAVTMYDSQDITRGDVIVFRDPDSWLSVQDPTGLRGLAQNLLIAIRLLPQGAGHHLIKRVIGLPGDHVVADGQGSLSVNGVTLDETYLKGSEVSSTIAFDVVVPEGCVWVMGDNRSHSADSRYHQSDSHGGAVPLADVVGVAKAVVWPLDRWSTLRSGEEVFADVPEASGGSARSPATGTAPSAAATLAP